MKLLLTAITNTNYWSMHLINIALVKGFIIEIFCVLTRINALWDIFIWYQNFHLNEHACRRRQLFPSNNKFAILHLMAVITIWHPIARLPRRLFIALITNNLGRTQYICTWSSLLSITFMRILKWWLATIKITVRAPRAGAFSLIKMQERHAKSLVNRRSGGAH